MKGAPGTPSYVMVTLNTLKLWVHPNGRFDLQDLGIPKQGDISIQGDKAILTVTKIAGKDVNPQSPTAPRAAGSIALVGKSPNTIEYRDSNAVDPLPVQLNRIATQPSERP